MTRPRMLTADLQRISLEAEAVAAHATVKMLERQQRAILAKIERAKQAMDSLESQYGQLDNLIQRARAQAQICNDCVRAIDNEL